MSLIGVIGGSGFYSLLENAETVNIETPHGWPSSHIAIGELGGRKVAFLARHGFKHEIPPHKVPYKANIYALHDLGCRQIVAATAVGSLKPHIKPGDLVVPDQYVNLTRGRDHTFYHGPETTHISLAEPYCPKLRNLLINVADSNNLRVHPAGTIVVIEGPPFSTKAESMFYRSQGWDIIGMTQYPEVALARELEMCYANIALVTDYDSGLEGDPNIQPVTAEEVGRTFEANSARLRSLIKEIVPQLPHERDCVCAHALQGARFSKA
jgi:5'-methylthioadenosine phosphorylase